MNRQITTVKIHNGKFTLLGYSRAGDATALMVPEMGFMLDAGIAAFDQKPSKVFISHCHSDHSFQLPYMYNRSGLLDVFVPSESSALFYTYLKSAQNLNDGVENGSAEKFKLHSVVPGQVIDINSLYRARIVKCCHTVPSVGYSFHEKRCKLKSMYASLTGKEIGELRKSGVEIAEEVEIPLFIFLGDTTPEVFDHNPDLFSMPYIVIECTFLEGLQSDSRGHTFWEGLRPHVAQHPETTFILIHFSSSLKSTDILNFFAKENFPNVVPFV